MHVLLRPYLALFFTLAAAARAASAGEMAASGISWPFFDAAGKLTHKLIAQTGTMSGDIRKLHGVELHYFSASEPNVIVQKLEATEASWDDKKETLAGHGAIAVSTVENRLTGEGFDFSLATSLLHIHRNFTMSNAEALLTSDRATIELVVEKGGENLKVRDVKRCEAIDHLHIVIHPAAQKRYPFKEAFSDLAVYEGATKVVTLPHPTRALKSDGGEIQSKTMTFLLGADAKNEKPSAAPAVRR